MQQTQLAQAQAIQQAQAQMLQQAPWLTKDQLMQDSDLMKNLTEQVVKLLRLKPTGEKQVTIATKVDQGNSDREPRN